MNHPNLPLGRDVAYPRDYDPDLLFPIPRAQGRDELGVREEALPFIGHDRWHAYELSWLDTRGKPQVATATIVIPADSPDLVESKSLKLYLNSLNASRFDDADTVRATIAADVSRTAGAEATVVFGLPAFGGGDGDASHRSASNETSIDSLEIDIDDYGPPNATHLTCADHIVVEEHLRSDLLKSNCPVTGQPDWATLHLHYRGPRIYRGGLLRYLVSFRDHAEFHEQCVERIFVDVLQHCQPQTLSVEARYTRRGGLDINPWRATSGLSAPMPRRELRQ
jgi:7-cyano-7-deazaguanine reductase